MTPKDANTIILLVFIRILFRVRPLNGGMFVFHLHYAPAVQVLKRIVHCVKTHGLASSLGEQNYV